MRKLHLSPFAPLCSSRRRNRVSKDSSFLASVLKETWKLFLKLQQISEPIPRQKANAKHGRRDSYIICESHVSVQKLILTGTTREGEKSAGRKNIPALVFHNNVWCQRLKVTEVNRGELPSQHRPRTTQTNMIQKLRCRVGFSLQFVGI